MGEKPTGLGVAEALSELREAGLSVALGPGEVSISGPGAEVSFQRGEREGREEAEQDPSRRRAGPSPDPTGGAGPPRR